MSKTYQLYYQEIFSYITREMLLQQLEIP